MSTNTRPCGCPVRFFVEHYDDMLLDGATIPMKRYCCPMCGLKFKEEEDREYTYKQPQERHV